MTDRTERVNALLRRHGQTFAEQAGIRLADKPSPMYRLLVLAVLLSARISADVAVNASKERTRDRRRAETATAHVPGRPG